LHCLLDGEAYGGFLFPSEWAYAITAAFWLAMAIVFGLLVRRIPSFPILLVLAITYVAATVYIVQSVIPILGWELLYEFP
jgi:hypothetical protein